jgi:two-component system NtrC family sensor kinase
MSRNPDQYTPTPAQAQLKVSEARELLSAPPNPRRQSDSPLAEPWRDVLLRLSINLPQDCGLPDLLREFMDGIAPLFPTCAVGACLVSPLEPPVVQYRLPAGAAIGVERDPTRLFPHFADERVFELDDGASGSTFHVACDQPSDTLSPLQLQIAEQASLVLSAAVRRARAFARAEQSVRNLHRLQAQVIQNEKLASLGQIVAGVVHELNNPLTSIIAYSDYLKKRVLTREESQEQADDLERLRRIGEAAERILRFSRDLVAYARPSTDVPGPVAIQDVIEKALIFCEHEFTEHSVELSREIAPHLPPVRGIAGQLTQVFVNLFTNAAHAMSGGGGMLRVAVHVAPQDSAMIVDVHDSGDGIHPSDMPQIFEPFFTTKSDGRGTGLGLSIVRGIMDAHGGTVTVQSAPGEGTVFRLTLPLAAVVPTVIPPKR